MKTLVIGKVMIAVFACVFAVTAYVSSIGYAAELAQEYADGTESAITPGYEGGEAYALTQFALNDGEGNEGGNDDESDLPNFGDDDFDMFDLDALGDTGGDTPP